MTRPSAPESGANRNEQPIQASRSFATRLGSLDDSIKAVCLGGSLTLPQRRRDRISDIDMFVYVDHTSLPALEQLESLGRLSGVTPRDGRERLSLSEFRCMLDGFDTNVKFFTTETLSRHLHTPPNLSEIWLEEIQSYELFDILFSRDAEVPDLLQTFRSGLPSLRSYLAELALESYGKLLSGAVKQGVYRSSEPSVAWGDLQMAVQYLVMIAYLQNDQTPIPFKWRWSPAFVDELSSGPAVTLMLDSFRTMSAADFTSVLRLVAECEIRLSENHSLHPWSRFANDRWWWTGYDPLTGHAPSHPFVSTDADASAAAEEAAAEGPT